MNYKTKTIEKYMINNNRQSLTQSVDQSIKILHQMFISTPDYRNAFNLGIGQLCATIQRIFTFHFSSSVDNK